MHDGQVLMHDGQLRGLKQRRGDHQQIFKEGHICREELQRKFDSKDRRENVRIPVLGVHSSRA
jgi:hypothetical protein